MIYLVFSQGSRLNTLEEQRAMSQRLLKAGLAEEYALDIGKCSLVANIWGKPFLRNYQNIHFSISHCRGAAALSIASCKTGIDVERIRPHSMLAGRKIFTEDEFAAVTQSPDPERDFFRFWTLKESYAKALGTGFAYPMQKISFSISGDKQVNCNKKDCRFRLFENEWGFIAAVCFLREDEDLKEAVVSQYLP